MSQATIATTAGIMAIQGATIATATTDDLSTILLGRIVVITEILTEVTPTGTLIEEAIMGTLVGITTTLGSGKSLLRTKKLCYN